MNERVSFVAVIPEDATIDLDSVDVICSPNPEDIAQFAIKQLSQTVRVALMSFGPKTVTSHAYLIGQESVLDSFLRSFIHAKREVKLFFENSKSRFPTGNTDTYYSITTEDDIATVYTKLSGLSALDIVKVTLVIECYSILLISLPAFIPFAYQSTGIKYETNSWQVMMNPSQFSDAKTFALLHFDTRLPNETTLMKFLTGQEKYVTVTDTIPDLTTACSLHEDPADEYSYEYSDVSYEHEAEWQKESSERGSSAHQSSVSDAPSAKSRHNVAVSARSRHSVASESVKSRRSVRSAKQLADDPATGETAASEAKDDVSVKSHRIENIPKKHRRRKKRHAEEGDVTMPTEISRADDSSVIPTEDSIEFEEVREEEDEEEDTAEMEIQKFVAQLQMNIPALTDTSVFSTLFQQLFYEKWKSGALNRTKSALSELRDKIKQKLTDETQSLKQLVESNDLTIFIVREEQKMRLLEKMSVETLEKALEKRVGSYSNCTTRGLLRTFQQICGDHITLQKQIREKRAAIRSETMELRIAQAQRMEKLQKYHDTVARLEQAAMIQSRMRKALDKHEQIEQELTQVEEERQALLQQLEKVRSVLQAKQQNVK